MLRAFQLSVLLCASLSVAAGRPRVVVVKSAELAQYSALVAGFSAEARATIEEVTLEEGADASAKAFSKIAEKAPALVLAIGPSAAVGARQQFSDIPIIFVMVPYFEKYELEGQNVTGIALTSDLSVELSSVKSVLPQLKRVGVVEDPRYSAKFIEDASQAAKNKGLTLVPLEVDGISKLDKVLSGAKSKIDALVLITDRTVGNATVVQRLLDWANAEKVPLIGLAPGQVKEGALLSFSPQATGLGQQAGRLANRVLHEKVNPGAISIAAPEGVEITVNLSTVKKLGDTKSFAMDLMTFAAQRSIAVRVIE